MRKFLTFLLLLLITIACSKNDHHDSHYFLSINDSIKSLIFKPGSFWIFKSTNSGDVDCTYVSKINQGIHYSYIGLGSYYDIEYYSVDYISTSSNEKSTFKTQIELSHMLMNPRDYYPWSKDPVLFTYTKYDWIGHSYGKYKYYDSLKIVNNTYYHVQECSFLSNSDSISFFTDSNIGFIRKIVHSKSSEENWNLDRWYIVK